MENDSPRNNFEAQLAKYQSRQKCNFDKNKNDGAAVKKSFTFRPLSKLDGASQFKIPETQKNVVDKNEISSSTRKPLPKNNHASGPKSVLDTSIFDDDDDDDDFEISSIKKTAKVVESSQKKKLTQSSLNFSKPLSSPSTSKTSPRPSLSSSSKVTAKPSTLSSSSISKPASSTSSNSFISMPSTSSNSFISMPSSSSNSFISKPPSSTLSSSSISKPSSSTSSSSFFSKPSSSSSSSGFVSSETSLSKATAQGNKSLPDVVPKTPKLSFEDDAPEIDPDDPLFFDDDFDELLETPPKANKPKNSVLESKQTRVSSDLEDDQWDVDDLPDDETFRLLEQSAAEELSSPTNYSASCFSPKGDGIDSKVNLNFVNTSSNIDLRNENYKLMVRICRMLVARPQLTKTVPGLDSLLKESMQNERELNELKTPVSPVLSGWMDARKSTSSPPSDWLTKTPGSAFKAERSLSTKKPNFQNLKTNKINNNTSIKPVIKQKPMILDSQVIHPANTEDLVLPNDFLDLCTDEVDAVKNTCGVAGHFIGNHQDDGSGPRFKGFNFAHSKDLQKAFAETFGLKEFRYNQLEAMNASLLKEDTFILMPTGGGKSLCYQLPAVITPGVTIVISPLRALIHDQMQKLSSLGIACAHLSSDLNTSDANNVYLNLSRANPTFKLLYVTPEKLSASNRLENVLTSLHKRDMLARFVIDEAHCVSQWGHDFRPDYTRLKRLREKFPGVPMMALTATATIRVRQDILNQLAMSQPKWFMQSFNRPNLKYKVFLKEKKVSDNIIQQIKDHFQKHSGIVYCLTRKECDKLADAMVNQNIKAVSYHAGLADKKRSLVQEQWLNDKYQVICATIAFGMGIDKPDVRFVIHQSMPRSVECYYQESGRAGRDGELAHCILYYSFNDLHRHRSLIEKDGSCNYAAIQVHMNNLFRMAQFCQNWKDCRRFQMLQYFGEIFERNSCSKNVRMSCDNCLSQESYVKVDITDVAKEIVQCVSDSVGAGPQRRRNITLLQLVYIFRGAKNQTVEKNNFQKLTLYGSGSKYTQNDSERIMHMLVLDRYLEEDMVTTQMEHVAAYVKAGRRAHELLEGRVQISFVLVGKKGSSNSAAGRQNDDDPAMKALSDSCYKELVDKAREVAQEEKISNYTHLVNVEGLKIISRELPYTEEDIRKIPHITHHLFEKYGKWLLDISQKYSAQKTVLETERAEKAIQDNLDEDMAASAGATFSPGRRNRHFSKGGAKRGRKRGASRTSSQGSPAKRFKRGKTKNNYKGKASSSNQNNVVTRPGFSSSQMGNRSGFSLINKKRPGFLT